MKAKHLAQEIEQLVTTYMVEIGLQTYFRKPHEMLQTPQWWKLQKTEALCRELQKKVQSLSADLIKELDKKDA
jgi:hypothetical protein